MHRESFLALPLLFALALTACGGGGGGGGGGGPGTVQMGGAIQGNTLNLTGAVSTLAGEGLEFSSPVGITTDGTHLYVADFNNHRIWSILITTGDVGPVAGAGAPGFMNGNGGAAQFNGPLGITTDGTNLYVADSGNNAIRKVVIADGAVSTVASGAEFSGPEGITTDGTNLYVADSDNHRIRKVAIADGAVSTVADGGAFDTPQGITTDGTDLYVADTVNNLIRRIQ